MPIEFSCPHCHSQIRVADGAGGKQGTCPQCRQKLVVPIASGGPDERAENASSPAVQFQSADPEPNASISTPEPAISDAFPEFAGPREAASSVRDRRRQRKRRTANGLVVPLICGGILFGALYWFFYQTNTGYTGTLDAEVVTQPVLPEGTITRAGLTVDRDAFERVREALEQQPFSLYDQHRLAEVELSANRAGLVVRVRPTAAARTVSLKLHDSKLREYVAENAREFNAARMQQIATYAEDFVRSWDGKTDEERAKLPNLKHYREDMALASAASGFGYHVALWYGTTSYPCIGVGSAGELYFCVPKELDQFLLKGHQSTPESPLFPGEYTVRVSLSGTATRPNENQPEPAPSDDEPSIEFKPADDSGEPGEAAPNRSDENEPERPDAD